MNEVAMMSGAVGVGVVGLILVARWVRGHVPTLEQEAIRSLELRLAELEAERARDVGEFHVGPPAEIDSEEFRRAVAHMLARQDLAS